MRVLILGLGMIFVMLVSGCAQEEQADNRLTDESLGTAVTLQMNWKRGHDQSGDFIELSMPCQSSEDSRCTCVVSLSGMRSPDFLEYISSFGDKKVPAQYAVRYGSDGRVSARFVSIGSWTWDRFPQNSGLLGVRVGVKLSKNEKVKPFHFNDPSDCFPKRR
jgi:hypothetical protein